MSGKLKNPKEYHKKWREAHKEERRQSQATYRAKLKSSPEGREKLYLQNKRYRAKYKEKYSERISITQRKYREAHKEELKRKGIQKYTKIKIRVLTYYGSGKSACVRCGYSDIRALSIDHINGGGEKQRKAIGWGSHIYLWLEKNKYPTGFQTLCMNCQYLKREENKEYFSKSRDEEKNKRQGGRISDKGEPK